MTTITVNHSGSVNCQTLAATTSNVSVLRLNAPTATPSAPVSGSRLYAPTTNGIAFIYPSGNVVNFDLGGTTNGLYELPTTSGTLASATASQTITGKTINPAANNILNASQINGINVAPTLPTNGQYLATTTTAFIPTTPSATNLSFYWVFNDIKTAGTNGQSLTAGYNIRTLSLDAAQSSVVGYVTNPIANVIRFVVPGLYRIQCYARVASVVGTENGNSQLLLSVAGTPTNVLLYGHSVRDNYASSVFGTVMSLVGVVEITAQTDCNVYHHITAALTNGAGLANGTASENYLSLFIELL